MWWNDIEKLQEDMRVVKNSLINIENLLYKMNEKYKGEDAYFDIKLEEITNSIDEILDSEDEFNKFNRMHDKLNILVEDENRKKQVILSQKTLDKFEDYMKNVDKLNGMINEFKGCVSLARGAFAERKDQDNKKKK